MNLSAWWGRLGAVAQGAIIVGAAVVVGASAAIHPAAPVGLVVGVAVAALAAAHPFNTLMAFLIILYTRPADMVPALAPLRLARTAALGALGLFILGRMFAGDLRFPKAPTHPWMILLTVGVFLSGKLGSDPGGSMAQFQDVFVKIIIIYVLILGVVDTPKRVVKMNLVLMVVTLGLGFFAIYAKLTGAVAVEGSRAAFVGLLGDPNDLALILLSFAPFALEAALCNRGKTRLRFGFVYAVLVIGVLTTQSRGGLLGIALGGGIVMRRRIKNKLVLGGIGAVALAGMIVASGMTSRQSGAVGHEGIDESAQGRLDAWSAGWRMFKRRPHLGVGFGRFAQNFDAYAVNPAFWGHHETHNAYIKAAAETGVAGFVPFMALVILSVLAAIRVHDPPEHLPPTLRALGRALLPMLAGFYLCIFFLSQCWSWFVYILVANSMVIQRVLSQNGTPSRDTLPLADTDPAA